MYSKYPLKDYFHFTKNERAGFNVLLILCLIIPFIPSLFFSFFHKKETADFSSIKEDIALFYSEDAPGQMALNVNLRGETEEVTYFDFNPNTATKEDFIKLGLKQKTAQTILNYREKVGFFKKKEDLKKVYGLQEEDYEKLENYINIPSTSLPKKAGFIPKENRIATKEEFQFDPNTVTFEDLLRLGISPKTAKGLVNYRKAGAIFKKKEDLKKVYGFKEEDYFRLENFILLSEEQQATFAEKIPAKKEYKEPEIIFIDINKASPEEWQKLKGIGPSYAKRIVKYREELGGFASLNQVAETYMLHDSVFQKIKPFLKDSPISKTISINIIREENLKKHPLFNWNEAKRIIAYRKEHGPFLDMQAFRKMPVFKDDFFKKVEPYLNFSTL